MHGEKVLVVRAGRRGDTGYSAFPEDPALRIGVVAFGTPESILDVVSRALDAGYCIQLGGSHEGSVFTYDPPPGVRALFGRFERRL